MKHFINSHDGRNGKMRMHFSFFLLLIEFQERKRMFGKRSRSVSYLHPASKNIDADKKKNNLTYPVRSYFFSYTCVGYMYMNLQNSVCSMDDVRYVVLCCFSKIDICVYEHMGVIE